MYSIAVDVLNRWHHLVVIMQMSSPMSSTFHSLGSSFVAPLSGPGVCEPLSFMGYWGSSLLLCRFPLSRGLSQPLVLEVVALALYCRICSRPLQRIARLATRQTCIVSDAYAGPACALRTPRLRTERRKSRKGRGGRLHARFLAGANALAHDFRQTGLEGPREHLMAERAECRRERGKCH